ncbi:hypothetical protein [Actinomyces sp.]|uniref:hypothetical protein n=1 Tax=Actinomyces sp. TaxID=29317 RepID=UPI0034C5B230
MLAADGRGSLEPALARRIRDGLGTLLGRPVGVRPLPDSHRASRRVTSALPGHDGLE